MNEIFDVTGDEIKNLNDSDLRELIGKLCESDYRASNLKVADITWGGNQNAGDGGLDVVIYSDSELPTNGFIPRRCTGFQIKKPSMNPAEIKGEMRPEGYLRNSIQNLIAEHGAYIIVSSGSSTTNTALAKRKAAMRNAVTDTVNYENLHIDFYDSGRIATWVRLYPSLILWVKERTGYPLQGWQSYGNWSASPVWPDDGYLLDDGIRLRGGMQQNNLGNTANDAIIYMRRRLLQPRTCLRLVGLSGVGKTRFVQALFEDQITENLLSPSWAIYTNMSDSPTPEPVAFARHLVDDGIEAILIIDNCPPDLHKRLVDICTGGDGTVRLLTIEYDVREDLPEETEVLHLEPASEQLIFQLISRRYPHIGEVEAHTISEFAGGNARVAIALASTFGQGETLGRLRDKDLFKRLFDQTSDSNEKLLHHAEVLSLMYSFDGVNTDSTNSEIATLASIISAPLNELYRSIAILYQRQLIQARGVWRAILPHAIANRLAAQALTTFPKDFLQQIFMGKERERLLCSFTRRLEFLHDSPEARQIVNDWLAPTGWLGKTGGSLTDLETTIFKNIAPVAPETVLATIEYWQHFPSGERYDLDRYGVYTTCVHLLRHIAYDPTLFCRSVQLLGTFVLTEGSDQWRSTTQDTLKSLFYLQLSGTHASAELRASVIQNLWCSGDSARENLALNLLEGALQTSFSSHHDFSFGARQRDTGWFPRTFGEIAHWYQTFISLGLNFAKSSISKAAKVKRLLADKFRGLWIDAQVYTELEAMCDEVLLSGNWPEGWIAIRDIIHYDKEAMTSEVMRILRQIEQKLRPANLLESAKAYAFSDAFFIYDPDKYDQDECSQDEHLVLQNFVKELGKKVIEDTEIFEEMLPDLAIANNQRVWAFGQGLAEGAADKMQFWSDIRTAYERVPKEQIQVRCIMGILSSPTMAGIVDEIMDSLVDDLILGDHYPHIQCAVDITPIALERLHCSLDIGKTPIAVYGNLAWSFSLKKLTEDEVASLLQKMITKEGGLPVVCDIFHQRIDKNVPIQSEALIQIGRQILLKLPDARRQLGRYANDFHFAILANMCLSGESAKEVTTKLCQELVEAIDKFQIHSIDYTRLFAKIAELHPQIFLDTFLIPQSTNDIKLRRIFANNFNYGENPIDIINESDIVAWCDVSPIIRYPLIATSITCFKLRPKSDTTLNTLIWNPLIYILLEKAPNASDILNELRMNLKPRAWSNSLADIMAQRVEVLRDLFPHPNSIVVSWAKDQYSNISQFILEQRERERREITARNETFE